MNLFTQSHAQEAEAENKREDVVQKHGSLSLNTDQIRGLMAPISVEEREEFFVLDYGETLEELYRTMRNFARGDDNKDDEDMTWRIIQYGPEITALCVPMDISEHYNDLDPFLQLLILLSEVCGISIAPLGRPIVQPQASDQQRPYIRGLMRALMTDTFPRDYPKVSTGENKAYYGLFVHAIRFYFEGIRFQKGMKPYGNIFNSTLTGGLDNTSAWKETKNALVPKAWTYKSAYIVSMNKLIKLWCTKFSKTVWETFVPKAIPFGEVAKHGKHRKVVKKGGKGKSKKTKPINPKKPTTHPYLRRYEVPIVEALYCQPWQQLANLKDNWNDLTSHQQIRRYSEYVVETKHVYNELYNAGSILSRRLTWRRDQILHVAKKQQWVRVSAKQELELSQQIVKRYKETDLEIFLGAVRDLEAFSPDLVLEDEKQVNEFRECRDNGTTPNMYDIEAFHIWCDARVQYDRILNRVQRKKGEIEDEALPLHENGDDDD
jgi:hypothetical protein